jgi:CheY-like chemotaxis protein
MKLVVPPRAPASPVDAAQRERPLVLYVEDDDGNREVAKLRLLAKYQVLLATNDREACELLTEHGQDLAIILMDIELKGARLNGVDLTRLVRGSLGRSERPSYAASVPTLRTPIFFLTAYSDRYRRAELLVAGGTDVLVKPIDFVALHTAMARAYLQGFKAP